MKYFSAHPVSGLIPAVVLLTKQLRRIVLCINLLLWGSHNLLLQAQSCPGSTVAGQTGQGGSAANLLNQPIGVAVDQAGNIYVADYLNSRIQKFPPNATAGVNGSTVAGATGMRNGVANRLNWPQGVTVDQAGYLYVTDYANQRIQKFPPNSTSATNGTTVAGVTGQAGSAANQLKYPIGAVAVDQAGFIYVADTYNHRIQKFPPNSTSATAGTTVAGVTGQAGSAANEFYYPEGVVVDPAGYIYVVDNNNHRVQKFPPNSTSATSGTTVAGGQYGFEANQLAYPFGIAIDETGNLFVADKNNNRIQKFPPNSTSATNGITVAGTGWAGSEPNELNYPTGVTIDREGNVFIADATNHRIQKFATIPPGVSLTASNAGVLTCSLPTLTLTAGSSTTVVSYSFASPGSFTQSGSSIIINSAGVYSVSAIAANGCYSVTTLSPVTNYVPPGAISVSRIGAIGCGPDSVTLLANASGASAYSLNGSSGSSDGQFVINTAGSYTLTASNGEPAACRSQTVISIASGTPARIGEITVSGPAACDTPTRLTASATGSVFIFTGPAGYVYSNVYRMPGTYTVFAGEVKTGGSYTLTVYGTEGCPPVSRSILIPGPARCP